MLARHRQVLMADIQSQSVFSIIQWQSKIDIKTDIKTDIKAGIKEDTKADTRVDTATAKQPNSQTV